MTESHDAVKRTVVAMYDRAAPLYDQQGTHRFTYFNRLLVDRLAIPPAARVLDLATGRGALLFAAAEKVGVQGQVIGIDLAPGMVAETGAEIARRGLIHASVLLMDADDPAFEPESFDFVLCGFALAFLDYERLLPRARNLLNPGGIFAATLSSPPLDESRQWDWLADLTRAVLPPDFTPPAWMNQRRLGKLAEVEAVLAQTGFAPVWSERHETTLYFRDEADWWEWTWSQRSRFWVEAMSPEALERFKGESFEHLRAMITPQGIPMPDGALFAFGRKL